MGLGSEQKLPFWGNQLILYYLALVPKVFFVLSPKLNQKSTMCQTQGPLAKCGPPSNFVWQMGA